jgi:ectoine hydroxylase-related dioxygenase (phytanoyl-CoA dioxygenase family)
MNFGSYGVLEREDISSLNYSFEKEMLIRKGYAVVKSGFSETKVNNIKSKVIDLRVEYSSIFYDYSLRKIDENNTIRAPLLFDPVFLDICLNESLLSVIFSVMGSNFVLNQQNVIINPAGAEYNQLYWHRDLPYQHFVSSRPLAVNALFCVDDFNLENGSTYVLPFSHKSETFPSENYLDENKVQLEAKKGDFILIDSMLYHCGGFNNTDSDRVGVNNVFSSPIIRRQIDFTAEEFTYDIEDFCRMPLNLLGLGYRSCNSVSEYLRSRKK